MMKIEKIKEDQENMIKDILELKRMINRLTDYVYHIQKYLINIEEKGDDDELYIEDIS